MKFYEEVIKKRNSCRGFTNKAISEDILYELKKEIGSGDIRLVDGIETELKFYSGHVWDNLKNAAGYNGFCIKAPAYMVLYSDDVDHYLENAGYIGQALTLELTENGIAACWQTINDPEAIRAALYPETDKKAACVIAFGYRDPHNKEKKAPKKSLDRIAYAYKYGNDISNFKMYPQLEDSLRAVTHSQSFLNLQPYKIIVDNDQIALVGIPDETTTGDDVALNYGIAMFNFYAVMFATRTQTPKWSFEPVTDRDLALPADVTYVAKIKY